MRRRGLTLSDGLAVPLWGEAEPVAGALFGADVGKAPEAAQTAATCPACGATGSHTCRGTAVAFPGQ